MRRAFCPGRLRQAGGRIRRLTAEVLAAIAPEADLSTVGDGEDLREALDLDSMDFLDFVIGLGQRSGVPIPEVDTPRLYTMQGGCVICSTALALLHLAQVPPAAGNPP